MSAPAIDNSAAPTTSGAAAIADPGPLGLAAFALTTFILSLANAGLVDAAGAAVVGLALFYGGIAQVIAGIFEFVKGNTFGATAFTSYGAFWLSLWYLLTHNALTDPKTGGWFLMGWAIFTVYMLVCSWATNGALFATFAFLTLAFIALALGDINGTKSLTHLGGYLGIITAFLAWYTSFAGVAASTYGRPVLPVFPRN